MWQALVREQYQLIALAPADGAERLLEAAGIRFVPLPRLHRFANSPWSDYRLLRHLKQIYQELAPQLILHFTVKPNIYGTLAASSAGIPAIATITGLGTTWLNGSLLRRITTSLYKYSLPRAEVVVCQNAHDIEDLQKMGVRACRWQLIPGSGIDIGDFKPASLPEYAVDERHFLFLGRMLIDKGVLELLNAWRQIYHLLPNTYLHLVGELDAEHPRCVPMELWEAGIKLPRVQFYDYQEDVRPFLQRNHVVILPSYREGIPRSLLEAMAMAKPIITTDVPGCRELVNNGKNGWRVPARSSAGLAEALLKANRATLSDLQELGAAGRKIVEEGYSEDIVAGQYLELLQEILDT